MNLKFQILSPPYPTISRIINCPRYCIHSPKNIQIKTYILRNMKKPKHWYLKNMVSHQKLKKNGEVIYLREINNITVWQLVREIWNSMLFGNLIGLTSFVVYSVIMAILTMAYFILIKQIVAIKAIIKKILTTFKLFNSKQKPRHSPGFFYALFVL